MLGGLLVYLISQAVGVLGGLLVSGDGGVQTVRLPLQGLHLLPDGVHPVLCNQDLQDTVRRVC